VKQALGGATKDLNKMIDKGDAEEVDPKQLLEEKERLDAMEEQENERKAKHQKVEVEREKERQRIRDKYGLKRKDEIEAEEVANREREKSEGSVGRLGRARSQQESPEEPEEDESLMVQAEKSFGEFQQKITTATESCVIC